METEQQREQAGEAAEVGEPWCWDHRELITGTTAQVITGGQNIWHPVLGWGRGTREILSSVESQLETRDAWQTVL